MTCMAFTLPINNHIDCKFFTHYKCILRHELYIHPLELDLDCCGLYIFDPTFFPLHF